MSTTSANTLFRAISLPRKIGYPFCKRSSNRYHTNVHSIRLLSTTTALDDKNNSSSSSSSSNNTETLLDKKRKLLQASLEHVPKLGWTVDAIYTGANTNNLPPSSIGLLSNHPSNDLIDFFMVQCNLELQSELQQLREETNNNKISTHVQIEKAIKIRLSKVGKYIHSKRWHEAMANGVLNNPTATAQQLNDIVTIIIDNTVDCPNGSKERIAIGIVYVTTELFMLTDTSFEYGDTWTFLHAQMDQLDYLASSNDFLPSSDTLIATTAILSSISGAVLSVAMPATRGLVNVGSSSIISMIMTFMQQQQHPQQSSKPVTTSVDVANEINYAEYGKGQDEIHKTNDLDADRYSEKKN